MARTNANWRSEPTWAARLARLDLYIAELDEEVQADVSKGPNSRSSGSVLGLLAQLRAERPRVEAAADRERSGGMRRLNFM